MSYINKKEERTNKVPLFIKRNVGEEPIAKEYFSERNKEYLQDEIIKIIEKLSDGLYKLDRQDDDELELIMQDVYLSYIDYLYKEKYWERRGEEYKELWKNYSTFKEEFQKAEKAGDCRIGNLESNLFELNKRTLHRCTDSISDNIYRYMYWLHDINKPFNKRVHIDNTRLPQGEQVSKSKYRTLVHEKYFPW